MSTQTLRVCDVLTMVGPCHRPYVGECPFCRQDLCQEHKASHRRVVGVVFADRDIGSALVADGLCLVCAAALNAVSKGALDDLLKTFRGAVLDAARAALTAKGLKAPT